MSQHGEAWVFVCPITGCGGFMKKPRFKDDLKDHLALKCHEGSEHAKHPWEGYGLPNMVDDTKVWRTGLPHRPSRKTTEASGKSGGGKRHQKGASGADNKRRKTEEGDTTDAELDIGPVPSVSVEQQAVTDQSGEDSNLSRPSPSTTPATKQTPAAALGAPGPAERKEVTGLDALFRGGEIVGDRSRVKVVLSPGLLARIRRGTRPGQTLHMTGTQDVDGNIRLFDGEPFYAITLRSEEAPLDVDSQDARRRALAERLTNPRRSVSSIMDLGIARGQDSVQDQIVGLHPGEELFGPIGAALQTPQSWALGGSSFTPVPSAGEEEGREEPQVTRKALKLQESDSDYAAVDPNQVQPQQRADPQDSADATAESGSEVPTPVKQTAALAEPEETGDEGSHSPRREEGEIHQGDQRIVQFRSPGVDKSVQAVAETFEEIMQTDIVCALRQDFSTPSQGDIWKEEPYGRQVETTWRQKLRLPDKDVIDLEPDHASLVVPVAGVVDPPEWVLRHVADPPEGYCYKMHPNSAAETRVDGAPAGGEVHVKRGRDYSMAIIPELQAHAALVAHGKRCREAADAALDLRERKKDHAFFRDLTALKDRKARLEARAKQLLKEEEEADLAWREAARLRDAARAMTREPEEDTFVLKAMAREINAIAEQAPKEEPKPADGQDDPEEGSSSEAKQQ